MSTNQNLRQHMRELIDRIKAADVAYYRDDNPTMTDREYDLLVDELKELETTTGLILSGSPTQTVPGEILKELMPVRHTKPMLSADKTRSVDEMLRFANGRPVVLSWKLDGLTIVLRYEGGEFKQAITRGREGIIGEDVTHTVRTFMNVPMCIPCTDKFEVRGEGVISWAHFEKINLSLSEPYSHPRNLAAGSVRMLDARESGKRYLEFFAFDLISDSIEEQSKTAQLQFLAENGFDVVPYVYTDAHDADELRKLIADFKPAEYGYPVDGVIMEYDNLVYGRSLGATGHHENRLMALKWEDELYETECTGLDVAVTRTGIVSLTATFKPVGIDGTMVSRAYVHNFTIYKNLALGIEDVVFTTYKRQLQIVSEEYRRTVSEKQPDKLVPLRAQQKSLRVQLGGIGGKVASLYEQFRSDEISRNAFLEKKSALSEDRDRLQTELSRIEDEIESLLQKQEESNTAMNAIKNIAAAADEPDDKLRERMYDDIDRVIVFDNESLKIEWKFDVAFQLS